MRVSRFLNTSAALVGIALLWTHPASAEEPVETAIKAWVAAIDAAPEWRATYSRLAIDPSTGRATLSGLDVVSETPGFSLSFRTVSVDAFQPTTDGTFAAKSIDLLGGEITAGAFTVAIPGAKLTAPVLPTTNGIAWDGANSFTAMVKAFAPLTRIKMASATAGSIVVTEILQGVATRTTYDQVKLSDWDGGKIAVIGAAPLRTDSPAVDPLVTLSARSAETRAIDLNAFLAVYDPARYSDGVGDGVWRTAVGSSVYRDVVVTVPGVTLKIGGTSFDAFRLRQSKTPPAPEAPEVVPVTGPAAFLRQLEALSIYGVGGLALREIDVEVGGLDKLHFGGLSFSNLSTDAIGGFAINTLEAAAGGQGSLKVGRLGFGGLVLPSVETLKAALNAREAGGNIDISSLVPPIAYVEASGVDVALMALPPVKLDSLRVDLGKYAGKVPTAISAQLAGADFPAAFVPSDRVRTLMQSFGYDRVHLDGGGKIDWSPTGDIAVKDFRLAMKDVGALSGDADLTGLTPADAEHMGDPSAALDKLMLKHAAVTFTDDSVVGRVIGAQAERLKVDPAKFREQFANGLPFMLTFLGDRNLQAQLAPILQAFVKTGGSITATVAPSAPLAVSALSLAARTSPFSLFGLLSATITGAPGVAPPPATDIRKSIAPAN